MAQNSDATLDIVRIEEEIERIRSVVENPRRLLGRQQEEEEEESDEDDDILKVDYDEGHGAGGDAETFRNFPESHGEDTNQDSIPSTGSESVSQLEVILQLNQIYQRTLEDKLLDIEIGLRAIDERKAAIESQLSSRVSENSRLKKKTMAVFSRPYFKDIDGSFPPANEDTIRKKDTDEIDPFVRPPKVWSVVERAKLRECVRNDRLQFLLRPLMNKKEMELVHLKRVITGTMEEKHIMDKINEIDKQITEIKESKNLEQVYGNLTTDIGAIDWMKIANIDFEGLRTSTACRLLWQNAAHPLISVSKWTAEEDNLLLSIVSHYEGTQWDRIAQDLGTNRTAFQCMQRYQTKLNPCLLTGKWTSEEDKILADVVNDCMQDNTIPWSTVAYYIEGRSREQCAKRWEQLHPTTVTRGKWLPHEDQKLIDATLKFGTFNWWKIKDFVPGRTAAQCRERWVNSLDSSIKFEGWSRDEDKILWKVVKQYGAGRWQEIASQYLPGRTDNMCLQRYNRLCRWKALASNRATDVTALPLAKVRRSRQDVNDEDDNEMKKGRKKTAARSKSVNSGCNPRLLFIKLNRELCEAERQAEALEMENALTWVDNACWEEVKLPPYIPVAMATKDCSVAQSTDQGVQDLAGDHDLADVIDHLDPSTDAVKQSSGTSDQFITANTGHIKGGTENGAVVECVPNSQTSPLKNNLYPVISRRRFAMETVKARITALLCDEGILSIPDPYLQASLSAIDNAKSLGEVIKVASRVKDKLLQPVPGSNTVPNGAPKKASKTSTMWSHRGRQKKKMEDVHVEFTIAKLVAAKARRRKRPSYLFSYDDEMTENGPALSDSDSETRRSKISASDGDETNVIKLMMQALNFHKHIIVSNNPSVQVGADGFTRASVSTSAVTTTATTNSDQPASTSSKSPKSVTAADSTQVICLNIKREKIDGVETFSGRISPIKNIKTGQSGRKSFELVNKCPADGIVSARRAIQGPQAGRIYSTPPLPPTCATLGAFRSLLLNRPRLIASAGKFCVPGVWCRLKGRGAKKSYSLTSVSSSNPSSTSSPSKTGINNNQGAETVEEGKKKGTKPVNVGAFEQVKMSGDCGIGKEKCCTPQIVKTKAESDALLSAIRATHDYQMLETRFRSLFLWPALLSTIPIGESDRTRLSAQEMTEDGNKEIEVQDRKEEVMKEIVNKRKKAIEVPAPVWQISDDDLDDDDDDGGDDCPLPFKRANHGSTHHVQTVTGKGTKKISKRSHDTTRAKERNTISGLKRRREDIGMKIKEENEEHTEENNENSSAVVSPEMRSNCAKRGRSARCPIGYRRSSLRISHHERKSYAKIGASVNDNSNDEEDDCDDQDYNVSARRVATRKRKHATQQHENNNMTIKSCSIPCVEKLGYNGDEMTDDGQFVEMCASNGVEAQDGNWTEIGVVDVGSNLTAVHDVQLIIMPADNAVQQVNNDGSGIICKQPSEFPYDSSGSHITQPCVENFTAIANVLSVDAVSDSQIISATGCDTIDEEHVQSRTSNVREEKTLKRKRGRPKIAQTEPEVIECSDIHEAGTSRPVSNTNDCDLNQSRAYNVGEEEPLVKKERVDARTVKATIARSSDDHEAVILDTVTSESSHQLLTECQSSEILLQQNTDSTSMLSAVDSSRVQIVADHDLVQTGSGLGLGDGLELAATKDSGKWTRSGFIKTESSLVKSVKPIITFSSSATVISTEEDILSTFDIPVSGLLGDGKHSNDFESLPSETAQSQSPGISSPATRKQRFISTLLSTAEPAPSTVADQSGLIRSANSPRFATHIRNMLKAPAVHNDFTQEHTETAFSLTSSATDISTGQVQSAGDSASSSFDAFHGLTGLPLIAASTNSGATGLAPSISTGEVSITVGPAVHMQSAVQQYRPAMISSSTTIQQMSVNSPLVPQIAQSYLTSPTIQQGVPAINTSDPQQMAVLNQLIVMTQYQMQMLSSLGIQLPNFGAQLATPVSPVGFQSVPVTVGLPSLTEMVQSPPVTQPFQPEQFLSPQQQLQQSRLFCTEFPSSAQQPLQHFTPTSVLQSPVVSQDLPHLLGTSTTISSETVRAPSTLR